MAGNTPNRVVRVPDDLWEAAQTAAAANGETVSIVIRAALADYVAAHVIASKKGKGRR